MAISGKKEGKRMSWSADFLGSLSMGQNLEYCLRILIALVCGAGVGIERIRHYKEAGVRTHAIVCVGAALMMIVSKYGFVDLALGGDSFPGTHSADPARIAAQVVSGISFLGAGVIFKREGLVRGLTTAAGIWITAGIGLAIGAGMILLGVTAAAAICIMQFLIYRYFSEKDGSVTFVLNEMHFTVRNGYDFHQALIEQIKKWHGIVQESAYTRNQEAGTTDYYLVVQRRKEISYAEMKEFISAHEEIISCRNDSVKK